MLVSHWTHILRVAFCVACAGLARAGDHHAARGAKPDQFRVDHWTSEQGLPQNTITALVQTRDGYLWAGTRYGLARFDGVQWTAFVNELSALDNEMLDVGSLVEDSAGRLWFHSAQSLVCLEAGKFKRWPREMLPFSGRICHLAASRAGGLWVTRPDGVFHWADGLANQAMSVREVARNVGGTEAELVEAWEDDQRRLWLRKTWTSGSKSLWQRTDPRTGAAEPLAQLLGMAETEDLSTVFQDRVGRLWVARPGELLCWDGRLRRFAANAAWGANRVKSMTEDAAGNLWIASQGPVQLHRFAAGQFQSFGPAEGIRNADDIRCLLSDREGNLWVGSGAGGLYRLQSRPLMSLLTGSVPAMDEVYSVAPGQDGRIWLATTYGLVKYQREQFSVYTNSFGLGAANLFLRVRPVHEDPAGNVWCGVDRLGLNLLRGGQIEPAPDLELPVLAREKTRALHTDRSGTLWLATQKGLWSKANGQWRAWTTNEGLTDQSFFGLLDGPDGSLWVGTEHGGVHHLEQGRFHHFTTADGLLDDNAWPLRAESDGTIWVGTERGLNRIRGGEIRAVTTTQGLFDNLAYCLLEDRQGRYWSFCNRGIWRMRKADLHAVADGKQAMLSCVSYGEDDGMASAEGNGDQQPNAAALPNGELWFPTTRGVVRFDPADMQDNPVPPGVVIEEVRADDELVFKEGALCGVLADHGTGGSGVSSEQRGATVAGRPPAGKLETHGREARATTAPRLPPGRARVLQVRYTANTFVDSELARFRYRLEGHEAQWQEARQRRVALYTNLRPGAYRFVVEACNSHGYWSEQPATFAFSLAPHFYQTLAFRGLCAGGVLALGVGWELRRRTARLRRQRDEMQRAVQEERSRIARDLHDDLGANLTGLALQVDAAQELPSPGEYRARQQTLARSLRTAVGRMREAIWTVDPACDTLESFCAYLGQHADTFLRGAGLRCRLDIPPDLPLRALSPEVRYHLFLIAKEALNNAVKHARAREVRIGVKLAGDCLILTVVDDGQGVPDAATALGGAGMAASAGRSPRAPAAPDAGRGVRNMRQRVESLGGEFELSSAVEAGTRLRVSLPIGKAR